MKHFKSLVLALTVALVSCCCATSCVERIDAGCEGIKVSLYGSDRGVDDVNLVSGWVWYNPISTKVYEYSTYRQTIDYPSFSYNSKDGSSFTFDPDIIMNILPGKSPEVFKRYRISLKKIMNETLFTFVQEAFKEEVNTRTAAEIMEHQAEFQDAVEERLRNELAEEGFNIVKVTSGVQYPPTLVAAVEAKIKAIQDGQRVQNEVAIAEAEARKIVVAAQAEKEANELRQKALTPAILESMWIEKWDGHLPQYGQVPTLFRDITK